MSPLLIIDNYDSFTWNLTHYIRTLNREVHVVRNDAIDIDQIAGYSGIILSPGPGLPAQAGITCAVVERYSGILPILGVCLGMQAIAEVYGARLINLHQPLHGVRTTCRVIAEDLLFSPDQETFEVGHYHSWVVDPDSLPEELIVTAMNEDGLIMAVRHATFPLRGVQFHPESVMTPEGMGMIRRFVDSCE